MSDDDDITQWLMQARDGDRVAANKIVQFLYQHIYAKAVGVKQEHLANASMSASALVNEVFVNLLSSDILSRAPNRYYLYAAAASAMREVLADYFARRSAKKRTPPGPRIYLDDIIDFLQSQPVDFLDLKDAMKQLENQQPRKAAVVQARFFLGDSMPEVAKRLGISLSTAEADLRLAKAWLYRKLRQ